MESIEMPRYMWFFKVLPFYILCSDVSLPSHSITAFLNIFVQSLQWNCFTTSTINMLLFTWYLLKLMSKEKIK